MYISNVLVMYEIMQGDSGGSKGGGGGFEVFKPPSPPLRKKSSPFLGLAL